MSETKKCSRCGKEKFLDEFYVCPSRPNGYRSECKKCSVTTVIKWYATPKGRRVAANEKLKCNYGITLNDYERILKEQNGVCAICGGKETRIHAKSKKVVRLAVDHDHKTEKVRGLVCNNCNYILGLVKDDRTLLKRMVNYLS